MTTLTALATAGRANPDDTVRMAYLDRYEEEYGVTEWSVAVKEFYKLCLEPRRYGMKPFITRSDFDGSEIVDQTRRALPGWRDWLSSHDGQWFDLTEPLPDTLYRRAIVVNWPRLLPSLWSLLGGSDRWRRKGATVEIEAWNLIPPPYPRDGSFRAIQSASRAARARARLTFARGWLTCVEFRDHQSADAMLPAILADQPFVEAGIKGMPEGVLWGGTADYHRAYLRTAVCGPAWELVEGYERLLIADDRPHLKDKLFVANDAAARARSALSAALIARAGAIGQQDSR